jgi:hypothetical protein
MFKSYHAHSLMKTLLKSFIKKIITGKSTVDERQEELETCLQGWKKYREILIEQKLDLDKQIEKILFSISTGGIGISVAFLDKISPDNAHSELYIFLGLGWGCLVISTVLQFISYRKTLKKINNSILKVEEITEAKTLPEVLLKESKYYKDWSSDNKKIDTENRRSYYFMISGVSLILAFAFISLFFKGEKNSEPIIINLYDSTQKKSLDMPNDNNKKISPQPKPDSSSSKGKSTTENTRSAQVQQEKLAREIANPPIRTKPKEK